MALTAHSYTKLADSMAQKLVDLDSDALKVMLLSAYTVGTTQDTAQFLSNVLSAATEASGTGYVAGGAALSGVSWTASGHVFTLTCSAITWPASTITASYAVFYDSTPGSNATNPVLCYWDFGGAVPSTAATYTLTPNGSGLLTFTGS